jgi:AcrR family transcriptional regulator
VGSTERRRREKQERRISILRAADEVFRDSGLADATMDDIARAAEVSKGTLYLYFENKDHLFLAVANQLLEELLEAVAEPSSFLSGFERTVRLLMSYAQFAAGNSARFRSVMGWMFSDCSVAVDSAGMVRYRELVGQLFERLANGVEAGHQDGSIDADVQPAQLVIQLWAGTYGLLAASAAPAAGATKTLSDPFAGLSMVPEPGAFSSEALVLSFVDSIIRSLRARGRPAGESGSDGDIRPVGALRSGMPPAPGEEPETQAAVGFE